MIKIDYYIGCNDKDTLKQKLTDKCILRVIDCCFDNYTVTQVKGKFTNEKGLATTKKTFIITLLLDENDKEASQERIVSNCQYLKWRLNQESILVTKEIIQANFY